MRHLNGPALVIGVVLGTVMAILAGVGALAPAPAVLTPWRGSGVAITETPAMAASSVRR
jgi:hypothetical protein